MFSLLHDIVKLLKANNVLLESTNALLTENNAMLTFNNEALADVSKDLKSVDASLQEILKKIDEPPPPEVVGIGVTETGETTH